MRNIQVGDKEYKVRLATTEEEKTKGLMGVKELPKDEGMLFIYSQPEDLNFWMKDTLIPLDIVFINSDEEVIKVAKGTPKSEEYISCKDAQYVLEVNADSGIKVGDECDLDNDNDITTSIKMEVLAPDGSVQMEIQGGERICSRIHSRVLIRKAKKAFKSKENKDYKSLGKYMFKVINKQDTQQPEYVDNPKPSKEKQDK